MRIIGDMYYLSVSGVSAERRRGDAFVDDAEMRKYVEESERAFEWR